MYHQSSQHFDWNKTILLQDLMVENKLHGFPAKISALICRRTTGIRPQIMSTGFCTMILLRSFLLFSH
ncbi:hypothetical protein Hanom_Chr10g00936761 [Helianthus anomalus]